MRQLAVPLANTCGELLSEFGKNVAFVCRYWPANDYKQSAFEFGLSDQGINQLNSETVLSPCDLDTESKIKLFPSYV